MNTDEKNNIEITQVDKDLTESELNRIFFGSETAETTISDSRTAEKKEIDGNVKKLKRSNPIPKSVIPPNLTKTPEESKRPQGRPLKWTPEKIEQAKRENAAIAEQRRKERWEKVSLAKLAINEPITANESSKLLNSTIKTRDEVEKQIGDKRTILKNIQNDQQDQQFHFLRGAEKTHQHLYKLNHFDNYGNAVVTCIQCSVREQMSSQDWVKYVAKNRKVL